MDIIVSNTINELHLQNFPNDDIRLYSSLEQLYEDLNVSALDADIIYVTEEIYYSNLNKHLTLLNDIIKSPLLLYNKLILIASETSNTTPLEFVKEKKEDFHKMEIVKTQYTVDNIISIIRKSKRNRTTNFKVKQITRVSKADYLKNTEVKGILSEEEKFKTQESQLHKLQGHIPESMQTIGMSGKYTEIIQVLSHNELLSALMTIMLSKSYKKEKVLIFDMDLEYFSTSYVAHLHQYEDDFLIIPIDDFISDVTDTLERIKTTDRNKVVITANSKYKDSELSFISILNVVSKTIYGHIDKIIISSNITKSIPNLNNIIVLEDNIVSVLKTLNSCINLNVEDCKFVAIRTSIKEVAIDSHLELSEIIANFFEISYRDVDIIDLREGERGAVYDLSSLKA